jgi:hypothetical protein
MHEPPEFVQLDALFSSEMATLSIGCCGDICVLYSCSTRTGGSAVAGSNGPQGTGKEWELISSHSNPHCGFSTDFDSVEFGEHEYTPQLCEGVHAYIERLAVFEKLSP